MSRVKTEKLHDFLVQKDMLYGIRATSYFHGEIKKLFMADCVQREWNESKMITHIIATYYAISSNRPTLQDEHMNHFKKILLDKIDMEKARESRQKRMDFDNDKNPE